MDNHKVRVKLVKPSSHGIFGTLPIGTTGWGELFANTWFIELDVEIMKPGGGPPLRKINVSSDMVEVVKETDQ